MHSILLFYLIAGGAFLSLGVVGNAIVIFYFGFVRRCEKQYELAMLILGVADFIASVSNVLVDWVDIVPPDQFKFDGIFCKYVLDFGFSTNTFAVWCLVLLFYVRYRCIVNPLQRQISKTAILIATLIIFILTMLSGIFFMLSKVYKADGPWCYNGDNAIFSGDWNNYYIYYMIIHPIGRFLIPLAIMILLCYQTRSYLLGSSQSVSNEATLKRNKRVLRTIMLLIVVFVLSVGPYEMYVLVRCADVLLGRNIKWEKNFRYSLMPTYYLNSALNVFVYAGYMPGFRKFCYKLLRCGRVNNMNRVDTKT